MFNLTGNLKHKDLTGQVVSSQAYVDDQDYYDTLDSTEAANENTPISAGSEDDGEAEWELCNVKTQALSKLIGGNQIKRVVKFFVQTCSHAVMT